MPAHRKPTAILEASGSFKTHPERARKNEPDSGRGIGPAPDSMSDEGKAIWDEIVGNCAAGVFQSSDRPMMECLALNMLEFRANPAGFGGRKLTQLVAMLSKCGMTPADRSRVHVASKAEEDKQKPGSLAAFRR